MRFPNAAKGMKKIYNAQILGLIGTIALIVALVLFVVGYATGKISLEEGTSLAAAGTELIIAAILALTWFVLIIIAFILNIVGVFNAANDESNFRNAWIFLVLAIATAMVSGVFASTNGVFSSLMYTLSSLMSLFVTIFIISGGVKLADQMNRGDVSSTGSNVLKLIVVIKVFELIVSLISSFMGGMIASVVAGVLAITAIVLSIIQYFMYLVFLNKAKIMLNE